MKKIILIIIIIFHSLSTLAVGGIPFFVNYSSDVYKAHQRNFDIVCDDYGSVYVANFEGILYYDQAQWRIIHTPGISRVTSIFKDSKGRIWFGGYHVFGYLVAGAHGIIQLHVIHTDRGGDLPGEVISIKEISGNILFVTSDGRSYTVSNDKIKRHPNAIAYTTKNPGNDIKYNQVVTLKNGWSIYATSGKGLLVDEHQGTGIYSISEANGLCNNNIKRIVSDGKGGLWGATDNGLFCASIPSAFTRYSTSEGLKGEVTTISNIGKELYIGTLQGLFIQRSHSFSQIPSISQACWQLIKSTDGKLFAATSDGVFLIRTSGTTRINNHHTLSALFMDNTHFYTGELDGIYINSVDGMHTKVSSIEKVKKIIKDKNDNLWAETVYGQVYIKQPTDRQFVNITTKAHLQKDDIVTLCNNNGNIGILNLQGLLRWNNRTRSFKLGVIPEKDHFDKYPLFIYYDKNGQAWQTNSAGKALGVAKNSKRVTKYDSWLHPIRDLNINAINVNDKEIWGGGDFGLLHWDLKSADIQYRQKSKVYIRTVVIGKDSVVWGGYCNISDVMQPRIDYPDMTLNSDERNISFTFSTDHSSVFGKTEYRYRLKGNNGEWSPWSQETSAEFSNLWYGSYIFQVMARDKYGRITSVASYPFSIQYPLYFRWYSIILYIILFTFLILAIIRIRMHKLMQDKQELEKIVKERTSEILKSNLEIEKKSKSLEKALTDLGNAQSQLIHQEKMATVGKLTKGLIDRILNPMNYINNFSHLSKGLIKDVEDDIEDDKDNMTADIYDDTKDVLSMVSSNLEKIEQHGMNTTRILKAMEEMLKERKGNTQPVQLASMFTKILEVTNSYHADKIKKYGINIIFENCSADIDIEANAEQLNKTLMSLIDNSIYAVIKKYDHAPYSPEIKISVEECDNNSVHVLIRDNGIGIEKTIIDNIFDPFFTTKTTGEAAGVGLYLSREIILDHGGTISVESEKDQYNEFLIILPIKNK